ncbi:sensor histidine kinase [Pedosphaera parvula]|uniref:histidine kinase n=1 Tax=Pedosphaera parvula (strain Ellin514) TaxID=320771 RepID=B9XB01_PEDPL|nr:sensor histidine kinase [Pedosphaera parvula]EEF63186.1 histidine kinase [Pedosphaera parvula Ellin514]
MLSGWTGLALASEPQLLPPDLSLKSWTREDGLPANSVTAVLLTRDGYVWVGTPNGLARFDGLRFVLVKPSGMNSNDLIRVTALCEDSSGRLWVGTQGNGLYCYAEGVIKKFSRSHELLDPTVTSIAEDRNQNLWIGTPSGLNRFEGSRMVRITSADGLPNDFISSINISRSGNVWITTRGGMCQYKNGKLLPLPFEAEGFSRSPEFIGVYEDDKGSQWAFGDTYLVNLDEGKRFNYFRRGDNSSFRIWTICEGRNGHLWVGTSGEGLFCFTGGKFLPPILREGRLPSDVRALSEDPEGNLWLGTYDEGLVRLQPRSVRLQENSLGFPRSPATCLAVGPDGRLWGAFEHGGIYSGTPDHFERLNIEGGGEPQNLIVSMCVAPDNTLWVATMGNGVSAIKEGLVTHYSTADGLSDDSVLAMAAQTDGGVWAGTRAGKLHRFKDGLALSVGRQEGLSGKPISVILPAKSGELWVGTEGGEIFSWSKKAIRFSAEARELFGKPIRALHEDAGGRLWIGSAGNGLACLFRGACLRWGMEQGLPDNSVVGILDDEKGNLWLETGKGICAISKTDVELLVSGRGNVRTKLLLEAESIPSSSLGNGWPRVVKSTEGKLWFATANGVVVCDPKGLGPLSRPPPVYIEDVMVNGQLLSAGSHQGRSREPQGGLLKNDPDIAKLPTNLRSLEVQYTAISFVDPEKIRFKHKLEGFDSEWVEASDRRVRYGKLPYGNYELKVQACNAEGVWNETGANFAFVVPTPAWLSWEAITLYGLGAVALVAGAVRWISYRRFGHRLALSHEQQAMEKERVRIAQDMHDEIGSKLTKISFLSERARGEINGNVTLAAKIESIAHTSRDLLLSLDELVWAVNPRNDTLEHLAAYLGQYAVEYLQNTAVECELHIPRELPHHAVSAELRHNLFLAFEETLNNALKHAKASRISITMAMETSQFSIEIEDNGMGFDISATTLANGNRTENGKIIYGNGLLNLKSRLSSVGGQCGIQSKPGKGTKVVLSIPVGATSRKKL